MVSTVGGGSNSSGSGTGSSSGSGSSTTTSSLNGQNGLYGVVNNQSNSSVTFSGLASGINTSAIIQQMLAVDALPEQVFTADQQKISQQESSYNSIQTQLVGLQAATIPLDNLQSFDLVTATSSNQSAVTVTAQTGAQLGTHSVTVSSLAKSEVLGSAPQTSQTSPLNFSGQILINGQAITVQQGDSLQSLASNINAANAGVNASIISPTSGQYYLTLGSNNSGLQGKISVSDVGSGNLMSQLGFTGGASSISHVLPGTGGGAGSDLFTDAVTPVGNLQGISTPPSGTVQITMSGGATRSVSIDLATQSLSDIASSINSAFGSNAATVQTVTNPITGTSEQQLQIAGATGFVDSNNVLSALGIYQSAPGTGQVLTAAQNASYTLDGIQATSATNSISSAISGVTINLLQDSTTTGTGAPASANFTIAPDTTTITTNIQAFVTQFNNTVDQINAVSSYNSSTGGTGPLFGDSTTENILNTITGAVTAPVAGLPSNMNSLASIGITIDPSGNGHLNLNSTTLASALSSNLKGVAQIFQQYGNPTDANVQFVSGTNQTQPSPSGGYAINITQPATQATFTASTAQTQPLAAAETLTFGGPLFGTQAVVGGSSSTLTGSTVSLPAGSTAQQVVDLINSNPTVGSQVSASLNAAGFLQLISKQYGSPAEFQVVSSSPGAANTSGIGSAVTTATGLDVQGTINGETATGTGQFLVGSQTGTNGSGVGQAVGLDIRVSGTTTGSYGSISYTSGVADQIGGFIQTQTDPTSGAITQALSYLQTQYNNDQTNINEIQANVSAQQTMLQLEFASMESTVSTLKSASGALASIGLSVGTSSSSSSSSSSTGTQSSSGSGSGSSGG